MFSSHYIIIIIIIIIIIGVCKYRWLHTYEGGSKSFRPDQLFKVTNKRTLLFFNIVSLYFNTYWYINLTIDGAIQGVSRLEDITAAGDFLGLSDQKSSHKHVSDFGRLRIYGNF
jgi:hypothetical protein